MALLPLAVILSCDSPSKPTDPGRVEEPGTPDPLQFWSSELIPPASLFAIWGLGPDEFVTGGTSARTVNQRWRTTRSQVLYFDRGEWADLQVPFECEPYGIWASSPDNIITVGLAAPICHFNGTEWVIPDPDTKPWLSKMWGSSPSNVYAIGGSNVLHFDGEQWITVMNEQAHIRGIWGAGPDDVYAVGREVHVPSPGGHISHWDGTNWTRIDTGSDGWFLDVWGNSDEDVVVVGAMTGALHFDGTHWAQESAQFPWYLDAITNLGPDGYLAVGQFGTVGVYDGSDWSGIDADTWLNLYDAWGFGSTNAYIVGERGNVFHFNGQEVTNLRDPSFFDDLTAVWTSPAGATLALGARGTMVEFDGLTWDKVQDENTHRYRGVWGTQDGGLFVVGDQGLILTKTENQWSPMTSGVTEDLAAIWGPSGSSLFAVGAAGTILQNEGQGWTPLESGTQMELNGVWGLSASDVFAVGAGGTILHFDGGSWSLMESGVTVDLHAVWGTSSAHVFAVGDQGTILRFDGATWSAMESLTPFDLHAIGGTGPDNVYAAGKQGGLARWDGKRWGRPEKAVFDVRDWAGLAVGPEGQVHIVGREGAVLVGLPSPPPGF